MKNRINALALVATLTVEFVLFHVMTVRHNAWIFPRWYDQVQYLTEAYQGYEYAQEHGFFAGLWQTLTNLAPQGTLHDFWGLLVFSIVGPSRSAALDINMVAFVAFQAATFMAVRRISGPPAIAWAAIAFLAALQVPWSGGSGSAIDFRLDWMAACAYGVALATAIAGNGFRSTRWALLFGVAVGAVLLTRSLTAVYFGLIYTVLLGALLMRPDRWRRSGRLILSWLVALVLAGPAFWINRTVIYNYYWIGHVAGPERALRDIHFETLASVKWLLSVALFEQIGLATLILGVGTAVILLGARLKYPTATIQVTSAQGSLRSAWALTLVFISAPAAVLSLHTLKAPQPVSILAPAAVWMAILGCLHLSRTVMARTVGLIGGCAALAGGLVFTIAVARDTSAAEQTSDAQTMNSLVDYFYYRAEECGLETPRLAVNWLSDGLSTGALQVLGYERHQRWMNIEPTLASGLFEIDQATVVQKLGQSDFVWLVTKADAAIWPFDQQMLRLLPEMSGWCDANMKHVGDLELFGLAVSFYERRDLERGGGRWTAGILAFPNQSTRGPTSVRAVPPVTPVFPTPLHALWSVNADGSYRLAAAYSPVRYQATGLPDGLKLDNRTGLIRGRVLQAGVFKAMVTVTNAAGSVTSELTLQVDKRASYAVVSAPKSATVGTSVEIRFEAFDARGTLNFVDITDLTTGKLLDRLGAGQASNQSWQGRYKVIFPDPGVHQVLFRFVCFDSTEKQPYTFFDETSDIEVRP